MRTSSTKKKNEIPTFDDEEREREFWSPADSTEYVDWSRAKRMTLPELKPSVKTISLRLPAALLAELKILANKRRPLPVPVEDVPGGTGEAGDRRLRLSDPKYPVTPGS